MPTTLRTNRRSQILAWAVASLFILGFFFSLVGAWTGPIMGVWFVGTQKPRRGFLWLMAFAFRPQPALRLAQVPAHRRRALSNICGLLLLAAVLGILPFTFHRLISPRLPGIISPRFPFRWPRFGDSCARPRTARPPCFRRRSIATFLISGLRRCSSGCGTPSSRATARLLRRLFAAVCCSGFGAPAPLQPAPRCRRSSHRHRLCAGFALPVPRS